MQGVSQNQTKVSLGLSVLMLEARDRVGGRTYTVEADGNLGLHGLEDGKADDEQVSCTRWVERGSRTIWPTCSRRWFGTKWTVIFS